MLYARRFSGTGNPLVSNAVTFYLGAVAGIFVSHREVVSDAEDSRNLLMQSQSANAVFIKDQPESFWGKVLSGATPDKINTRMNELRESLCAVNMVSLAEAIAYQEMGETEAAKLSLLP